MPQKSVGPRSLATPRPRGVVFASLVGRRYSRAASSFETRIQPVQVRGLRAREGQGSRCGAGKIRGVPLVGPADIGYRPVDSRVATGIGAR
jgi:hypothetical protein